MKPKIYRNPRSAYRVSVLFLHLVFILILLSATLTKEVLAAPQLPVSSPNIQLISASDVCEPNENWVWAYGPSRPDIARQAELALKRQSIEASVRASDYGETDSCGNFEPFSTDFKVTVLSDSNSRLSASAQTALAEHIPDILSGVVQSKLGNVQVDLGSGETKLYTSPGHESLTLPDTTSRFEAETLMETTNKKVFLLVFGLALQRKGCIE